MSIYASCSSLRVLEVGCAIRLAMMFERADPFYDQVILGGMTLAIHAIFDPSLQAQKVCEYILRGMAVPGLSPVQQIECAVEGALILQRMGLMRKCALLLYISALMAADMGNMLAADELISKALSIYEIGPCGSTPAGKASMWKNLEATLLASAAMFAQENLDTENCARWAGQCLQLLALEVGIT